MGSRSRSKGRRSEQEVVRLARAVGLHAERTWHLAQSPNEVERCCDLQIAGRPYQAKRRHQGFAELYEGLEHVAGLFIRADGREWLVCLRAEDYLKLVAACGTNANGGEQ